MLHSSDHSVAIAAALLAAAGTTLLAGSSACTGTHLGCGLTWGARSSWLAHRCGSGCGVGLSTSKSQQLRRDLEVDNDRGCRNSSNSSGAAKLRQSGHQIGWPPVGVRSWVVPF